VPENAATAASATAASTPRLASSPGDAVWIAASASTSCWATQPESVMSPSTTEAPAPRNALDDLALRERAITLWPDLSRERKTADPTKPVPPVRKTFMTAHSLRWSLRQNSCLSGSSGFPSLSRYGLFRRRTGLSAHPFGYLSRLMVRARTARPWSVARSTMMLSQDFCSARTLGSVSCLSAAAVRTRLIGALMRR